MHTSFISSSVINLFVLGLRGSSCSLCDLPVSSILFLKVNLSLPMPVSLTTHSSFTAHWLSRFILQLIFKHNLWHNYTAVPGHTIGHILYKPVVNRWPSYYYTKVNIVQDITRTRMGSIFSVFFFKLCLRF